MYLFNLFLSSLYLDKDIGYSINKPLVFAGDTFKIRQQLFNENKPVRLTECANSIGHWLADSTFPSSHTETDESVIYLDDV